MPPRTPEPLRDKVKRLRKAGDTYEAIRIKTGLAGSTIAYILGKANPKYKPPKLAVQEPDTSQVVWCDVCKATVHPPCVACQVRRHMAAKKEARKNHG